LVQDYVDAIKNKELATPNMPALWGLQTVDGYDGGLLPLMAYMDLERLVLPLGSLSQDGRLRDHMRGLPPEWVTALLGVNTLITDRVRDAWINDVYLDLSWGRLMSPAAPRLVIAVPSPFPTTHLALVAAMRDSSLPSGTPVATVVLQGEDPITLTLRIGAEVDGATQPAIPFPDGRLGQLSSAFLPLPSRRVVEGSIVLTYSAPQGTLEVRGLTLVDRQTATSRSLVLSEAFVRQHLADVKVYQRREPLPMAFLVTNLIIVDQGTDVVPLLASESFDPLRQAVVSGPIDGLPAIHPSSGSPGTVMATPITPEHWRLEVETPQPALVVIRQSYYPGWEARSPHGQLPIVRVNGAFQGIPVSAGQTTIDLVFVPATLTLGAALSVASALAITGLLWHGVHSARRPP
jgi:hypothetical protein